MKHLVLLAALTAALMVVQGCQQSSRSNDNATTGTSSTMGDYTIPFQAVQQTSYRTSPGDTTSTGQLNPGDTVYFKSDPGASRDWTKAKDANNNTIYVKPSDFRRSA